MHSQPTTISCDGGARIVCDASSKAVSSCVPVRYLQKPMIHKKRRERLMKIRFLLRVAKPNENSQKKKERPKQRGITNLWQTDLLAKQLFPHPGQSQSPGRFPPCPPPRPPPPPPMENPPPPAPSGFRAPHLAGRKKKRPQTRGTKKTLRGKKKVKPGTECHVQGFAERCFRFDVFRQKSCESLFYDRYSSTSYDKKTNVHRSD